MLILLIIFPIDALLSQVFALENCEFLQISLITSSSPEREKEASASSDLSGIERESVVGEGGGKPGEREHEGALPDPRRPDHREKDLERNILRLSGCLFSLKGE